MNASWFLSPLHARTEIERWRLEYNEDRPKWALDGLTPVVYANWGRSVGAAPKTETWRIK